MSWFFKQDLRHTKQEEVGWTPYPEADSKKLEKAYAKGQKKVKLNDTYTIHFQGESEDGSPAMFQARNDDFNRQRPVKREESGDGDDDVEEPPKKKAKISETKAEKKVEKKKEPKAKAAAKGAGAGAGAGSSGKPLAGKTFCITGKLSQLRAKIEGQITKAGGSVAKSMTKAVTHLIMGPDVHGTTKHQKAKEAGVTILTEDEFSEMLEGNGKGGDDKPSESKGKSSAAPMDESGGESGGDDDEDEKPKANGKGAGAGSSGKPLAGKTFCITGKLSQLRAKIEGQITKAGGSVAKSMTKAVTHLIMGPDVHGTTKHQKAEEAGVTILTEDEFSEMLEGKSGGESKGDSKSGGGNKKGGAGKAESKQQVPSGAGAAAGHPGVPAEVFTGGTPLRAADLIALVKSHAGKPYLKVGPPATDAEIAEAEKTLGHPLPEELRTLYKAFSYVMTVEGAGGGDDGDGSGGSGSDGEGGGKKGKKRKRDESEDEEEDDDGGNESDGFDSDGLFATPLLFGLLKAPPGDDEFEAAVLTSFNHKQRNESEEAPEKCALWNHFVTFGTEASSHWTEHDVPVWSVRRADNGIVRPDHYLWDTDEPAKELKPFKKSLVAVWKKLIKAAAKSS